MKKIKFLCLVIVSSFVFNKGTVIASQVFNTVVSNHKFAFNGTEIKVGALNINGENYIKVSDLGKVLNMNVSFNELTETVNFESIQNPEDTKTSEDSKPYSDYLSKNAISMDTSKVEGSLTKDKTGFDKYNIYLVGENHGTSKTYDIELYFLKYFNQTQSVKYLISEVGYSDASLINKYLKTGDIKYIDIIMRNLSGTFAYSENMVNFYKNIYQYNEKLDDNKKIQFIGVDVQHQFDTGVYYLSELIPKTNSPDAIKIVIEELISYKEGFSYKKENFQKLFESFNKNKELYKNYLGNDYPDFENAIINIKQGIDSYDSKEFSKVREDFIIENFMKFYEEKNITKAYGIFGSGHTYINEQENKSDYNLGGYLNHMYKKTKGKVASINLIYSNSFYMSKQKNDTEPKSVNESPIVPFLVDVAKSEFTFFKLDNKDSIFIEDNSTMSQQYLVLIKDSEAVKKYKEK